MKVFLSWSGDKSHETARILGKYIKKIIQAVDPWISSEMSKGVQWAEEIGSKLQDINFGIICLTRENLNENWILFEAGALSKNKSAHVCTFLLELKHTDIKPPLAFFHHTTFVKNDILKLLNTINEEIIKESEGKLSQEELKDNFNDYWPKLEDELKLIANKTAKTDRQIRSDRELIEEILVISREWSPKKGCKVAICPDCNTSMEKFFNDRWGGDSDGYYPRYISVYQCPECNAIRENINENEQNIIKK